MRVAISGASGLVGSALIPALTSAGHQVRTMVRPGGRCPPGSIAWDPQAGSLDLAAQGGALAKMLTPFKLGVAGKVGRGYQYMSWIALDDVVGVIRHALATTELSGPVNTVAPTPVTNLEFTKTLGRVLSRPTVLPMPALAARLVFGEMARELLVSGQRAVPARLLTIGFRFRYPELEQALRSIL